MGSRLYIKNLPTKVKKPDVRMALYMLFSTYGPVLDVVHMRTAKSRGQAHVAFRDVQSSTQAMRALQGFDFFGNELVHSCSRPGLSISTEVSSQDISYGRGRSNVFTKLEGVYKAPTAPAPETQASVFTAPLPSTSAAPAAVPQAAKLPPANANGPTIGDEEPHGVKRTRDDESDEGDAPMEEDDDDVSMEASSDEE